MTLYITSPNFNVLIVISNFLLAKNHRENILQRTISKHVQNLELLFCVSWKYLSFKCKNLFHHHHVPSPCWGLDSMVLCSWSWQCCVCLTVWWYSSPVHLVMFVVHFVLGLPRPLEPFTFLSNTVRCSVSPLWQMMWPKYCNFLCAFFLFSETALAKTLPCTRSRLLQQEFFENSVSKQILIVLRNTTPFLWWEQKMECISGSNPGINRSRERLQKIGNLWRESLEKVIVKETETRNTSKCYAILTIQTEDGMFWAQTKEAREIQRDTERFWRIRN